tara:strand:+ start:1059 stop:1703 length:645 start_codon:yes stop_codon:yes gene_type:complete
MLNISTPFSYYVCSDTLDYDFTELRKDKRTVWVSDQKSYNADDTKHLGTKEYHEKFFRVLESYPSLKKLITDSFNSFLREIYGPVEGRIITSWINTLEEGDQIGLHRHNNCFYSGILYYGEHYDKDSARLWLINPLQNTLNTFIPKYYNPHKRNRTQDNVYLEPFTGALYFFPSNIFHEAGIHKGPNRSSLAFNFVIDSDIWNNDSSQISQWKQ